MRNLDKIKNLIIGLRDLTTIGSANIIAALISGIFWFYMAALLGTEQFGKISYFIAIATIVSTIASLGSVNTVLVYTAKEKKVQTSVYFVAITSSITAATILFFVFYNLGVSLYVLGAVIFGLALNELLAKQLYKNFLKYVITQRILLVGFAVSLYYLIGLDGIILGFALSYYPYIIRIYRGFRKIKIDLSIIRSRSGFMINNYVLDLYNVISTSADKLIILPLFGFSLLGNYSLAMQFLMILTILPNSIYQYLLPHYASGNLNKKITRVIILSSVVIAALGILLAPLALTMLFLEFSEAATIIQIMSVGIIPLSIGYMYNAKFLGMQKSKNVLIGSSLYLSIQFLGIFLLGNIYGINGAAIAFVLGASMQAIYLIFANKILEKNKSNQDDELT